jgi:vacuolar protein sorting-associated protein IST1
MAWLFCLGCRECNEELREAAASIMFAAGWCGDLPELLFARTILAEKFGNEFAVAAKEGTDIVDPIVRILIHLIISSMSH